MSNTKGETSGIAKKWLNSSDLNEPVHVFHTIVIVTRPRGATRLLAIMSRVRIYHPVDELVLR